ncbi:MAG: hypothetical protein M3Y08_05450 [Fibrobacterota bacterium]|nr:hypothetical protein [Fibrobacterota bacterium]
MKTEKELIKDFAPHGHLRGGEFYLPYPKALEFIDECAKNELAVVGVDGYTHFPEDDGIMAHFDMIANFCDAKSQHPNWNDWVDHCRRASHEFLQTLASEGKTLENHLFNFVALSKKRWEE